MSMSSSDSEREYDDVSPTLRRRRRRRRRRPPRPSRKRRAFDSDDSNINNNNNNRHHVDVVRQELIARRRQERARKRARRIGDVARLVSEERDHLPYTVTPKSSSKDCAGCSGGDDDGDDDDDRDGNAVRQLIDRRPRQVSTDSIRDQYRVVMQSLEKTRTCVTCRRSYRPIDNFTGWHCRVHPGCIDHTPTASTPLRRLDRGPRYPCCRQPAHKVGFTPIGCTPAMHVSDVRRLIEARTDPYEATVRLPRRLARSGIVRLRRSMIVDEDDEQDQYVVGMFKLPRP